LLEARRRRLGGRDADGGLIARGGRRGRLTGSCQCRPVIIHLLDDRPFLGLARGHLARQDLDGTQGPRRNEGGRDTRTGPVVRSGIQRRGTLTSGAVPALEAGELAGRWPTRARRTLRYLRQSVVALIDVVRRLLRALLRTLRRTAPEEHRPIPTERRKRDALPFRARIARILTLVTGIPAGVDVDPTRPACTKQHHAQEAHGPAHGPNIPRCSG